MRSTTKHYLQKICSLLAIALLVTQSLAPGFAFGALAQTVFADELPGDEPPTPEPTPIEEVSPTPTEKTTPAPIEEITPTTAPVSTETPTPTDTVEPTPTEQIASPDQSNTEPPKETGPPQEQGQILDGVSTAATPTPSLAIEEPADEGELHTLILQNVEAESLDLDNVDPNNSASLSTDKADYAPTDTAVITGIGFTPSETYTLIISSDDPPPTSTTTEVTADENGTFIYAYQLDGTYRPNYKVEVKNETDIVLATTTFTDSATLNSATLNGSSSVTVAANASITAAVNVTNGNGSNNRWKSTAWRIATTAPGATTCVNTTDHTTNGETAIESFSITAPGSGGTYNAYFIVYSDDACSQNASSTITLSNGVVVDTTAPTDPADVASTSHGVDTASSDNTIDMAWTAAGSAPGATDGGSGVDGYSYEFSNSDTTVPDTTKDAEEGAIGTTSDSLADGTWYFHLSTVDNAGNWTSTVHEGPFTVDTQAPVSSFSSPADPSFWNSPISIEGSSTDVPDTTVDYVTLYYWDDDEADWIEITQLSNDGLNEPFNWNYDWEPENEGVYDILAEATDTAGNTEESPQVNNVYYDLTDPTSEINYPEEEVTYTYNDWEEEISGTASDENSGVSTVYVSIQRDSDGYYWDGEEGDWVTGDAEPEYLNETYFDSGEWSYEFEFIEPIGENQGYTARSHAEDNAGNLEDTNEVHFYFQGDDVTEPTTPGTPTTTTPTSNTTPTWDWTASSDTNFDHYVFFWDTIVDGETYDSGNITDNFFTHLVALLDGTWYGKVKAYDAANNFSTSDNGSVLIDTTTPTTPTATPPAGDYTSDQSVTLDSTDDDSGLAALYYTTDGTTPDNTSTVYTGAITVDHDMTIKAIAYDNAGNASSVLSATYGIAPVISGEVFSRTNDTSLVVSWTTDDPATSRVIYDTVSHPVLGATPNYGYANSTVEDSTKVTSHSVVITGLTTNVTYYYRTVSHGSPETVGEEQTYTINYVFGVGGGDGKSDGKSDGGSSGGIGEAAAPAGTGVLGAVAFAGFSENILGTTTEGPTASATISPTPKTEEITLENVLGKNTARAPWWLIALLGFSVLTILWWLRKRSQQPK